MSANVCLAYKLILTLHLTPQPPILAYFLWELETLTTIYYNSEHKESKSACPPGVQSNGRNRRAVYTPKYTPILALWPNTIRLWKRDNVVLPGFREEIILET